VAEHPLEDFDVGAGGDTHDGLRAVDDHGTGLTLPSEFIQGRRSDGSPNCSHAWARTVDGIQGGTWPQIHLLGTTALQRFTGYTAQSRGRHATHTWNVTRLPDFHHGGVLADQRTPEREVLDALRRQPDTGFAIHDAPTRRERLLAERAELRALLHQRPSDRHPAFHQAELALEYAKKDLYWAHHRLDHAQERLEQFGALSQLRRHGCQEKASTGDQIDRFTTDIRKAEAKIASCEQTLEGLQPELGRRLQWDIEHKFPDSRLSTIDAELAEIGNAAHPRLPSDGALLRRAPGADQPAWLDRLAEISPPALPGRDTGIDLGL
jgi:hypothetical protein